MVGRRRDLEILGASHVLDDALAVVGPPVDAEREVSCCVIDAPSRASDSAQLRDRAALLKPPHSVSSSFAHAFQASQLF